MECNEAYSKRKAGETCNIDASLPLGSFHLVWVPLVSRAAVDGHSSRDVGTWCGCVLLPRCVGPAACFNATRFHWPAATASIGHRRSEHLESRSTLTTLRYHSHNSSLPRCVCLLCGATRMMWLAALVLLCLSLRLLAVAIAHISRWRTRRQHGVAPGATMVGFFHPFCAGGGGGERVLWRAVHTLSRLSKDLRTPLHVLIYTGDTSMKPEEILSGVARQFEIPIDPASSAAVPVSFVYLRGRGLLDASLYPVLTMLAQSLASVVLASEALVRGTPDVFVDTTGFAFSFPVAWFAGCSVGAYVHYPTISTVS